MDFVTACVYVGYVCFWLCCVFFFFFKQKTAYEMRISDWSSDVCSSDLLPGWLHFLLLEGSFLCVILSNFGQIERKAAVFESWNEIGRASCRERVCQYV